MRSRSGGDRQTAHDQTSADRQLALRPKFRRRARWAKRHPIKFHDRKRRQHRIHLRHVPPGPPCKRRANVTTMQCYIRQAGQRRSTECAQGVARDGSSKKAAPGWPRSGTTRARSRSSLRRSQGKSRQSADSRGKPRRVGNRSSWGLGFMLRAPGSFEHSRPSSSARASRRPMFFPHLDESAQASFRPRCAGVQ